MIRSLFFILFLLMLAGCSSPKKEEPSAIVASHIKLTDLDGKEVDLAEYQGKTIFVNFWATWCRPCIQEMPSIATLESNLSGNNIVFFFASDEDIEKIIKFKESRGMTSHFVRVENPEALGIDALPTTFIFNGEGNLVYSEVGFRQWDQPATMEMVMKFINE